MITQNRFIVVAKPSVMKEGDLMADPSPGTYMAADSAAKLPASKFYLSEDLLPEFSLSTADLPGKSTAS